LPYCAARERMVPLFHHDQFTASVSLMLRCITGLPRATGGDRFRFPMARGHEAIPCYPIFDQPFQGRSGPLPGQGHIIGIIALAVRMGTDVDLKAWVPL